MDIYSSISVIDLGPSAFRVPKSNNLDSKLHGYFLKAKISITSKGLNDAGNVIDLLELTELKKTLNKTFNYKTILSKNDPAKHVFKELERYTACDMVVFDDGVSFEKFAEFVFNTADNFIKFKTNNKAWCEYVEVFSDSGESALFKKTEESKKCCGAGEVKKEEMTLLNEVKKIEEEKPAQQPEQSVINFPQRNQDGAAPVGNRITSGWSNPFGGTSWGM